MNDSNRLGGTADWGAGCRGRWRVCVEVEVGVGSRQLGENGLRAGS